MGLTLGGGLRSLTLKFGPDIGVFLLGLSCVEFTIEWGTVCEE